LANNCSIILGNIPSYASGSNPFGKSDIADGLLEVLQVKSLKGFFKAITIGAGKSVIKAKNVEISLAKDEFIQLDGEDFSGKLEMPIRIEFGGTAKMLYL